jgi:hypothetical protein
MTLASKPLKESEKAMMSREDACYNIIDETQSVNVKDAYTKHFKYLGSYISYSLQDDYDIKSRIAAATKAFGANSGTTISTTASISSSEPSK